MLSPAVITDLLRSTIRRSARLAWFVVVFAMTIPALAAPTARTWNLVELIRHADRILDGTVTETSIGGSGDDLYTEITLFVAESILGTSVDLYTFRQPRSAAPDDGSAPGLPPWELPTWTPGERAIVFLSRPEGSSGLQTTVGLRRGKLRHFDGRLSASSDTEGLLRGIVIDASGLSLDQVVMLEGGSGVIVVEALLDLIRRAVREDWIALGVMRSLFESPATGPSGRASASFARVAWVRSGSSRELSPCSYLQSPWKGVLQCPEP